MTFIAIYNILYFIIFYIERAFNNVITFGGSWLLMLVCAFWKVETLGYGIRR